MILRLPRDGMEKELKYKTCKLTNSFSFYILYVRNNQIKGVIKCLKLKYLRHLQVMEANL